MNKSTDLEPIASARRDMNEMGFYWSAYFVFGTPEETPDSIRADARVHRGDRPAVRDGGALLADPGDALLSSARRGRAHPSRYRLELRDQSATGDRLPAQDVSRRSSSLSCATCRPR